MFFGDNGADLIADYQRPARWMQQLCHGLPCFDLVVPAPEVEELRGVDDVDAAKQVLGLRIRLEDVSRDEVRGWDLRPVEEEIVSQVDERLFDLDAVDVLRRGAVEYELAEILRESAPHVEEFLTLLQAFEDLGVARLLQDAEVEEMPVPD